MLSDHAPGFHKCAIFATMANKSKNKNLATAGTQQLITVDPSMPSYEGHPYFEKKAAAAKHLLAKVGLPKHLSPKAKAKQ